jgi:hypothetical protein
MRFNSNLANMNGGKSVDIHEQKRWGDLENVLNNGIEFGRPPSGGSVYGDSGGKDPGSQGNIKGAWINVTTPATPDTDFVVEHNLGVVPVGTDVKQKSAPADVYTGSAPATAMQLTLRSTAASAKLVLFVH